MFTEVRMAEILQAVEYGRDKRIDRVYG